MKGEAIATSGRANDDSQAILLLCSTLALPKASALKPLSRSEWNDLARAISASPLSRPAALFDATEADLCNTLHIKSALAARILDLLSRGGQLALERERLKGLGIWALTRADKEYPHRLKERLKGQAPPVLFGAGPVEALSQMGLAVVGSRDVDEAGAAFAAQLGERCVREGLAVFSGGARGVDQVAVKAALDYGGVGVAILADSLEETLKKRDVRLAVLDSHLTIVTALHPSTRFTVAGAMGRNKLIYALASWAVVVSSGLDSGGTWAGATENLRAGWVPLLVRNDSDVPQGNRELIRRGATPLSKDNVGEGFKAWLQQQEPSCIVAAGPAIVREAPATFGSAARSSTLEIGDLFPLVWPHLAEYLATPRTEAEVVKTFMLERAQAKKWLERAVQDGRAEKLKRPVRFHAAATPQSDQKGLFDG